MANLNFNRTFLCGRLTHDVELRKTASGVSVCSFSIAVKRDAPSGAEAQTDFIDCQAWRGLAETIAMYFKKGSSIFIVGKLQKRDWTDNNGQKRYVTEVKVEEVDFVDSRSESTSAKSEDEQETILFGDTPRGFTPIESADDDFPF